MRPVLAAADVAAVEQGWASQQGGSTWPLMAAAGKAVAQRVMALKPHGPVWVLAGKGNNGGDGYVAAWHLRQAGFEVCLVAPLGPSRPDSDADRARQQWLSLGEEHAAVPGNAAGPVVVVDAVLGSGQSGSLSGSLAELMTRVNRLDAYRFAIDVPTGLNADTGVVSDSAFQADQTLSFIAYKPGLLTGDGPACVGVLELETLGIDAADQAKRLNRVVHAHLETAPVWPERNANGHKGRFGQVSVVAGSQGMGGAGLLAARAALAAGAGKVVWHTTPENAQAALIVQPELMTEPPGVSGVSETSVVVVGPGLGRDTEARRWCDVLTRQQKAGVLDADGLAWLADNPRELPGWVLTPHPGEAAAMLGSTSAAVQADRCTAALELSRCYQAVVVLKGAGSMVADQGQLWFCHPGTVAMATPGMGDTLAGWIGGLMAQGFSARQAAQSATWWHAALAARLAGHQRIVLATDLLPLIQAARLTTPVQDH